MFQNSLKADESPNVLSLDVDLQSECEERPYLHMNESYQLNVNIDSSFLIKYS